MFPSENNKKKTHSHSKNKIKTWWVEKFRFRFWIELDLIKKYIAYCPKNCFISRFFFYFIGKPAFLSGRKGKGANINTDWNAISSRWKLLQILFNHCLVIRLVNWMVLKMSCCLKRRLSNSCFVVLFRLYVVNVNFPLNFNVILMCSLINLADWLR